MNGFVAVHIDKAKGDVEMGKKIMECFEPAKIPALTTLAQEFCVCDRWFSAVPGPTWLNRFYAHAATCDGMIVDTVKHNYKMKTIYDSLDDNGVSWNIYYGNIPQSIMLEHHWRSLHHFKRFGKFYADIEKGELAAYTFIEPRYFNFHQWKANDQHPPHDVMRLGEYLIAERPTTPCARVRYGSRAYLSCSMTNMEVFSTEFPRQARCQVRMEKRPNIPPSILHVWGCASQPSLFRLL